MITALFFVITLLQGQALEDGTDSCSETSVINYHYSLRYNPEEHSPHINRDGSLKSRSGRDVSFTLLQGRGSGIANE
jgi:hypothetical protein